MTDKKKAPKRIFFAATDEQHLEWKVSPPRLGTTGDELARCAYVWWMRLPGESHEAMKANAERALKLLAQPSAPAKEDRRVTLFREYLEKARPEAVDNVLRDISAVIPEAKKEIRKAKGK